MDPKPLPARPSLEQYKKQAKELVKLFRAAQSGKSTDSESIHSETIQRVKKQHPHFADLPDEQVSNSKFALADAQFILAREHGFESWPKFAKHIEEQAAANFAATVDDPLTAFMVAACVPRDAWHASGTLERAEAILAAHPGVAAANIHTAAILGNPALVRRFLAVDAGNATAKGGPYGWDALTHLCFSRYLRLDRTRSDGFVTAARALLDAGASANTGWREPNPPYPSWEPVIYGAAGLAQHPGVTRLLLERGADPNDDETPYHVPETYDNTVMKILVESGSLSAASLTTLLVRKADWHDTEGLKWLLEHGADPNRQTRWGRTAFHQAILRDNGTQIVSALLEHGADPTLIAERLDHRPEVHFGGISGIDLAARRGRGDVLELLQTRGIPIELHGVARLIAACARNDAATVQAIKQQEPELVRELVVDGGKLLSEFAGTGNADGVRLLLDLGVPVNGVTEHGDPYFDVAKNSTALHSAAWRARPGAVKLLLERGASVNALDSKGRTALVLAVRACVDSYWTNRRTPETVEALLDAGASIGGVEFPSGYAEVDELLRKHGALD
jgi:ankyrin repeat protein